MTSCTSTFRKALPRRKTFASLSLSMSNMPCNCNAFASLHSKDKLYNITHLTEVIANVMYKYVFATK